MPKFEKLKDYIKQTKMDKDTKENTERREALRKYMIKKSFDEQ